MKYLITAFLLVSSLVAQQAPKPKDLPRPEISNFATIDQYEEALIDWKIQQSQAKAVIPAPKTLSSCRASLKNSTALTESLKQSLSQTAADSAQQNKQLAGNLAAMTKKYNDAITILATLSAEMHARELTDSQKAQIAAVSPGDALDLGVDIEKQEKGLVAFAKELKDHDEMVVNKYNSLFSDYKDYVNRVSIQLAQINHAQRVSNALALYNAMKPAPIQLPLPMNSTSINCTSNNLGYTTVTNCH